MIGVGRVESGVVDQPNGSHPELHAGLLPDGRLLYYRAMDSGASDATWEFVVATILEAGPA